jgi:HEPN domain-containing protein
VCFTLHKATTIYRQIEDGHLFYSAICITDHLVYDSDSRELPTVNATVQDTKRSEAQKEFGVAYEKAVSFFEGAKMYIDYGNLSMAAFMLHQTIELTLRGLIKSFGGVDIRTHSISALLKNLRGFFPELASLFHASTPEEAHAIELLDKAYLNSRYGYLEIKKEDLSVAMIKSERMLILIKCP